ncbi:MAG TPA: hypothetical protein PLX89_09040 [Verrucomicrobiota bacterium]|nr:hypothetical protein [Verrucomicrobiota bacterium]
MSTLVPNLPVETAQPQLVINSRELGFGFFRVELVVRDDSGNVSANPASAEIFISRGDEAIAVLRSPPIALLGQAFPLYGAESFTKGGGRVIEYRWSLTDAAGNTRTFQTRVPTVVIGGPPLNPLDPLPRDLRAGKYRLSLVVRDDAGADSAPDEHPLTIVPANRVGKRPVAQARLLVDGRFADRFGEGTPFELDGSNSVPSSPPAGPDIRRYIWTWFPLVRSPWEQETVREPIFRPPWKPRPGLHRFRLVVIDADRVESAPTDIVLQVTRT